MHVSEVRFNGMKRFKPLRIHGIPQSARLVVLVGQNGSGKSSVFDGFRLWHGLKGGMGHSADEQYLRRPDSAAGERTNWQGIVHLRFHEVETATRYQYERAFYIRSAHRNEADFTLQELRRTGSLLEGPRVDRLIDTDVRVSDNYLRLVSASVDALYSGRHDERTAKQMREDLTGELRASMKAVFEDLDFKGLGDPLRNGSFYFDKGASRDFHYKNLSAGEKSAFDLLLDFIIKRAEYRDTVFCIDEPETHMHTRLQGRLLRELFRLTPSESQLWIATHAIGMLRTARDLGRERPGEVVFLDFHDLDFDEAVEISPSTADRPLWLKMLAVAMDDLATLIAPRQLVLCEGRPHNGKADGRAEFDARCYRRIFAREFSDTEFVSVGNSSDVQSDCTQLGRSVQAIVKGTSILRGIDRDDRSVQEVGDLQRAGVRVLRRRHLESYLMDDEILSNYCESLGSGACSSDVLASKKASVEDSTARGNPVDDIKSASGQIYNQIRKILRLSGSGSDAHAFMRDVLSVHVVPGTLAYRELKEDVFGRDGD